MTTDREILEDAGLEHVVEYIDCLVAQVKAAKAHCQGPIVEELDERIPDDKELAYNRGYWSCQVNILADMTKASIPPLKDTT